MKKLTSIILFLLSVLTIQAAETVKSPDGRLAFTFEQSDGSVQGSSAGLFYTISRDGKELIAKSRLGVAIDNHLFESALGVPNEDAKYWGTHWCDNLKFIGCDHVSKDTLYTMPYGEWAVIPDHYNEMTIKFMKGQAEEGKDGGYVKSKCYFFNIKVRAYNEGIAFCYEFPETSNGLFINLQDELTEFCMPTGCKALCTAWAQGKYEWRSLSEPWTEQAERPLTLKLADGTAMSLLEARCVDYARTKFVVKGNGVVKAQPYGGVELMTPYSTSWRLVMIGDNMTDLCNHDYMVLNLNAPEAKCIPHVGSGAPIVQGWSWIQPGKVFRCDLKKQAIKDAVDFAAKHNMQFVHLDAGWYGPEMKMESSALKTASNRDFTIPEAVKIAAAKGIGLFVYVNQRALYKELDQVLDSLQKWGVKGVKFGFVQVGNQQWTTWLHDAVRKCAEHHLMVDIHDEYRPTGYSRTYPNLMTAEGIAGNEEMPTATHNVTLPFTRFLCGPADYTLCYFNGRVKNTYAHQLAMAAVYYSPLTWMYWYDKPAFEHGEKELEFWDKIPTTWDDTKVLQGEPGEYIVTARRHANDWFVGAMNNGEPIIDEKGKVVRTPADAKVTRTVTLPLNFLDPGKKYIAHLYEDFCQQDESKATLKTRTKVKMTTKEVTSTDVLTLPLLNSGGAAIWLERSTSAFSAASPQSSFDADKQLKNCNNQIKKAISQLDRVHTAANGMEARNILYGQTQWNCRKAKPEEWCSGFWPGMLWMDYEANGDKSIEKAAEAYTQPIIDSILTKPIFDHDLGFIVINSLIKGYDAISIGKWAFADVRNAMGNGKLAGAYKENILKAADMLATQFSPRVGTILSWPRHVKDFGGHNTIMDNMLNLELLYWAADHMDSADTNPVQGGASSLMTAAQLRSIATTHAETTMKNHFRPDGSCYHVAVYDTIDGHLKYRQTHQGYADYSMWTRGQAWAIYGYTMVYRYTKDKKFLDFAQKVTDIYLKRLHETSDDWIPLWDMDARPTAADYRYFKDVDSPTPSKGLEGAYHAVTKDASAAAAIASALLDLSKFVGGDKGETYRKAAIGMLSDLSSKRYLSSKSNVAILNHSTGHHPAGSEVDASIVYADYYYLEALLKLKK